MNQNIDNPFVGYLEQKNENVKFLCINSDLSDTFKEEVSEEDKEAMKADVDALTELFRKVLGKETLDVKVEKLKNENLSSMITISEESRRMAEMMKMYSMPGMDNSMFGTTETLVLNYNNKLVQYVLGHKDGAHTNTICEQLYDLAGLSHGSLTPERMTKFIARSNELMMIMAEA
jgi:molecular chaperone HtpG